jgi:hypothetical protein
MVKRVAQSFFSDLDQFVADDGLKRTCRSIHNHIEFGRKDLSQLASCFGECTWQVPPIGDGASQIQEKFSAFLHYIIGLLKRILEDLACGFILWQLRSRGVESQEESLYSLEKVVVKVARRFLSVPPPARTSAHGYGERPVLTVSDRQATKRRAHPGQTGF